MTGSSPPHSKPPTVDPFFSGAEIGSDPEISITLDLDELEAAQALQVDVGTATRVDEQIETRAKKSILIPSEHPARGSDSIPPRAARSRRAP